LKNVSEKVPGLAFINQLRPVIFSVDYVAIREEENRNRQANLRDGEMLKEETLEDRESASAKSRIVYSGFIAQEVEAAAKSINYNFSGVDAPKNASGQYGLRYAEFVAPLVKAVQEQQEIIENQQKQIDNLIQRIEILESK
jgi:hypothetical protein